MTALLERPPVTLHYAMAPDDLVFPEIRGPFAASDHESFTAMLRAHMDRCQMSCKRLGRLVGVDASYVNRLRSGHREPPRVAVLDAIARGLELSSLETDLLFQAAGYLPPTLAALGVWEETVLQVAAVLADPQLSGEEKDEYRAVIASISARWRAR